MTAQRGYVIRTKEGEKGPFDTAQLAELVDQGKIPPQLKVGDVAAGEPVTVSEVLDRSSSDAGEEGAGGLADETEVRLDPVERRTSGRWRSPARRPRGGRGGASGSRGSGSGGRGSGSGGRGGASATRRKRRKKSSNLPLFAIAGVAAVVLVVVLLVLFLSPGDDGPLELQGTWTPDVAAMEATFQSLDQDPNSVLVQAASEDMRQSTLRFDGNRMTGTGLTSTGESAEESVTFTTTDLGGGHYELTVDDPDGQETVRVEVDGDQMRMHIPGLPFPLIFQRG